MAKQTLCLMVSVAFLKLWTFKILVLIFSSSNLHFINNGLFGHFLASASFPIPFFNTCITEFGVGSVTPVLFPWAWTSFLGNGSDWKIEFVIWLFDFCAKFLISYLPKQGKWPKNRRFSYWSSVSSKTVAVEI